MSLLLPPILLRLTFSHQTREITFSREMEKILPTFAPQTRFAQPFLFSLVELEMLLYQFTIFTMDSNEILRMHQLLEVEDLSFKLQLEEGVSFVTISFPKFIFVSHNPKIKPHT